MQSHFYCVLPPVFVSTKKYVFSSLSETAALIFLMVGGKLRARMSLGSPACTSFPLMARTYFLLQKETQEIVSEVFWF